ncbi:MAG: peptidylprolyl isomerase [Desulfatiglans sp.]|jgi:FKBP-type peptidyl-prolyl cis-trans isomerase SlyD|nr:peptidylprolyl isomerase [Desulfatiglans sp.]
MNISDKVFVSFDYRLTLDSGEEIDKSPVGKPLGFITGAGQIIPGLEEKMIGMAVGDKANISVAPENAYGLINPDLFQAIKRDQFPDDIEIRPGMTFQSHGPQGPMIIKVKEVKGNDTVVIDLNHPLAGERLHFDVNIAEVRQLTSEERDGLLSSCGCDCGSGHSGGCDSGGCGSEGSCCH